MNEQQALLLEEEKELQEQSNKKTVNVNCTRCDDCQECEQCSAYAKGIYVVSLGIMAMILTWVMYDFLTVVLAFV